MTQQLSVMDASFVYSERAHAAQHISMIAMYDPATAAGGRVNFDDVLANVTSRLDLARAFRQRIVRVPLDVDLPYWVEDDAFDIEFHVREVSLPKPGTWRQFWVEAARLCAIPVDAARPLWELYVVEGLDELDGMPEGTFAMILKAHHAAVDGLAGMEMFTALHDLSPEPEPVTVTAGWKSERAPSTGTLLGRAGLNASRNALRLPGKIVGAAPRIGRVAVGVRRKELQLPARGAPTTRFNAVISPHRALEARRFPLSEMKRIKAAVEGATVNDVAVAVVGGALRIYLSAKGELPDQSLTALVPISVRTEQQQGTAGNEISGMTVAIGTHIADPLARLDAIRTATRQSKELNNAIGARTLTEISAAMPGALFGLAARATSSRLGRDRTAFNVVVSNVPGPQTPLYSCGARMSALHAAGPLRDQMGLFHVVTSYCGTCFVTAFACHEMLPDPVFYGGCLDSAFDELARAIPTA